MCGRRKLPVTSKLNEAMERIPWICDICTATWTFEAMQWCIHREDPDALCGYDRDQPSAMDGVFEFYMEKNVLENETKRG